MTAGVRSIAFRILSFSTRSSALYATSKQQIGLLLDEEKRCLFPFEIAVMIPRRRMSGTCVDAYTKAISMNVAIRRGRGALARSSVGMPEAPGLVRWDPAATARVHSYHEGARSKSSHQSVAIPVSVAKAARHTSSYRPRTAEADLPLKDGVGEGRPCWLTDTGEGVVGSARSD